MDNVEVLNKVSGAELVLGPGALPRIDVRTPLASAQVYLQGAHVAAWQPAGQKPVLWMSQKSLFQQHKPLRGGVPICWPWFGAKEGDPDAPAHGVARLVQWALADATTDADGNVVLTLATGPDDFTRQWFDGDYRLEYRVSIGKELTLELTTLNKGPSQQTISDALHTYFAVGDVRRIGITGLAGAAFIDKMDNNSRKVQDDKPFTFSAETDRIYIDTQTTTVLEDPVLGRRISVAKSGSKSTVVWNPWVEKSRRMPDFGDDEWPGLVCIETANAADNELTLAAGQSHTTTARLSVQ